MARQVKFTIEQLADSPDATGAATKTWSTFAEAWGEIEATSGKELYNNNQFLAVASHVVRMRRISGILPEMRVNWGAHLLIIQVVQDPAPKSTLLQARIALICSEPRARGTA